jgi:hypothetical protein
MQNETGANGSGTEAQRSALVANIRALADFIESRTDLPVPDSVDAQHSIQRNDVPDYAKRLDMVRQSAEVLPGSAISATGTLTFNLGEYPARVQYVIWPAPERAQ